MTGEDYRDEALTTQTIRKMAQENIEAFRYIIEMTGIFRLIHTKEQLAIRNHGLDLLRRIGVDMEDIASVFMEVLLKQQAVYPDGPFETRADKEKI